MSLPPMGRFGQVSGKACIPSRLPWPSRLRPRNVYQRLFHRIQHLRRAPIRNGSGDCKPLTIYTTQLMTNPVHHSQRVGPVAWWLPPSGARPTLQTAGIDIRPSQYRQRLCGRHLRIHTRALQYHRRHPRKSQCRLQLCQCFQAMFPHYMPRLH